jgi:DNA-binding response OmpR family regulator
MGNKTLLHGKTVLVVDDEPDVLEVVSEMLDMCEVHKAENFDKALDYLQNNSYDLVILDIMGVNGFELLKRAVARGFVTLMLTAHAATLDAMRESIKLGAAAFLPKESIGELKEVCEDLVLGKGKSFWWRKSFHKTSAYFAKDFSSRWKDKEAFLQEVEEALDKKK